MVNVKLIYHTPIDVIACAIRTCTNRVFDDPSKYTVDALSVGDESLINHCINNGHESVLEHVYYTFYIEGLSRAALQELARHRVASFSVKSTRYTLKQLTKTNNKELAQTFVPTGDLSVDKLIFETLQQVRLLVRDYGIKNDIAKYALPEAFKTTVQFTINVRSLRNFINLRSSKRALWEMRYLANEIYNKLPKSHQFMYEGVNHYGK